MQNNAQLHLALLLLSYRAFQQEDSRFDHGIDVSKLNSMLIGHICDTLRLEYFQYNAWHFHSAEYIL